MACAERVTPAKSMVSISRDAIWVSYALAKKTRRKGMMGCMMGWDILVVIGLG